MFAKSTILLAAFAVATNLVSAQNSTSNSTIPPGCVLNAARLTNNPGDFKAICGSNSTMFHKSLESNCGDNISAAESAYTSICKDRGFTVADAASATSSHSANGTSSTHGKATATSLITTSSYNSDCKCTKTSVMTSVEYAAGAAETGSGGSGGKGGAGGASDAEATGGSGSSAASPSASATAGSSSGAATMGYSMSAGAVLVAALAYVL